MAVISMMLRGVAFWPRFTEGIMSAVKRMGINQFGRDYAVGDIHAHVSRLLAALHEIDFDFMHDRLIATGDLVDRGSETEEVLWLLAQPWFFSVMGNHDDLAIRITLGTCIIEKYIEGGGQWNVDNSLEDRQRFADAFKPLPFAIQVETSDGPVGIVHADCPYDTWKEFTEKLEAQTEGTQVMKSPKHDAMWNRQRLKRGNHDVVPDVKAVVVGHCTVPVAKVLGNVHYIDTGGWTSRRTYTFLKLDTLVAITVRTKE
jgi:serine/threonine protein phosphatase 1